MMGPGGWPILGSSVWLVVLALVIAGGVWLGRRLIAPGAASGSTGLPAAGDTDAAREMLRRRYAAGEIDDEEFERRLAGLNFH
jgi:putative membrane protein